MKVSIIQSNFIPWIGYFSVIKNSDLFILYEDVQYTKNDWRNRNRFLINNQNLWITLPVNYKFGQKFNEIRICSNSCFDKIIKIIEFNYKKRINYKNNYLDILELFELSKQEKYLKNINRLFIKYFISLYNIKTPIIYLENAPKINDPTKKLIEILKINRATQYLSGPLAKNYLNQTLFNDNNIKLEFINYNKLINPFLNEKNINFKNQSIFQFFLESA